MDRDLGQGDREVRVRTRMQQLELGLFAGAFLSKLRVGEQLRQAARPCLPGLIARDDRLGQQRMICSPLTMVRKRGLVLDEKGGEEG